MVASRWRGIASGMAGALGILLVLLGVVLGYATHALFNEWVFSDRIAASLQNPRVADFVAQQIADATIAAKPDLVGLRPVLIGVGRSLVSSAPFRAAVRRGARAMHRAILNGTGRSVALSVKDLGILIESAAALQPGLAKRIPARVSAALGRLDQLPAGEQMLRLARLANRMRAATLALYLLGLIGCVAGVWLSVERRRAIVRLGMALIGLGLVLAIVARFGAPVLGHFARPVDFAQAIAGVAGAFLGGLVLWAAGLGFAGLVLAAASASLLERIPLQAWSGQTRRWLIEPQPHMRIRLLRGALGAAVGTALLLWPLSSLMVAAWLAGLVVAFGGLREAFVAALHLLPQIEHRAAHACGERPASRGAVVLVSGLAIALLAVAAWVIFRPQATRSAPLELVACNGSPILCDRPLDQVIFPTAHNAMGGADVPGWMFPSQSAGIRQQLDDGIRGLLIDVHYGVPIGDRVKTELEDEHAAMAKYESVVGKEGMEAAVRIRNRMVGEKEGARDVYLCHGFCELGALRLIPVLRDIRDFMVANPGEVLMICIQDEGVTAQDVARCFEESGLIDFVYRGPVKPPWPTLREMVDTDQRVLVTAEHVATGVDWYHPAFEVMQETPYTFRDPSEFSNAPNRGGTAGSLYLLNHWIETAMPKPSNAAVVNARDALLARIQGFERERGHVPNLVAVDFYKVGDLIPVVRELNERPMSARLATASRRPAP
jgi:hypothetical protein